ncbi:site-specific integrase [Nonomuraea sp. KC401]|uniref:tyrosine-type recombinase/integrase n=1 Tax=unclassified Nonomuraea TaxID=2593643 RepID=UPI0010FF273A|nr:MULTISPECIES: tyrosine-type recombinase/integrase [unclassified Nonomuraea]NBE96770.1 tyrosine-type recombinase/integrase [Nonomuraea sp. K271]TLF67898.1 site-specific integrase [Nonomuraea sp. KC401]
MYGYGSATGPSEEAVVFDSMLEGWSRQQAGARRLQPPTIAFREQAVRRFATFAAAYPWQWSSEHVGRWIAHLVERRRAQSTVRRYQSALRLFCDYVTSPRHGWPVECEARFGRAPAQVFNDWSANTNLTGYRGDPARRPMTREEVQLFLDHADDQVEVALRHGRKGALARYRDATVFKVLYAWGLRCSEASGLDVYDFVPHAGVPELGRFGSLDIRAGRRIGGLPPQRRTVVSLMPWAVEAVQDYLHHIRPRYRGNDQDALWLTERGSRLGIREIEDRFAAYRDALDLDRALTPHCMRTAYMAHLLEDGSDLAFVQKQVGHSFAVTTAACVRTVGGTA